MEFPTNENLIVELVLQDILFDPRTSGGLLICVNQNQAEDLIFDLIRKGISEASVIDESGEKLLIKWRFTFSDWRTGEFICLPDKALTGGYPLETEIHGDISI